MWKVCITCLTSHRMKFHSETRDDTNKGMVEARSKKRQQNEEIDEELAIELSKYMEYQSLNAGYRKASKAIYLKLLMQA